MPQTVSDIKALLASRGIHPRHRFGQNFLIDPNKLQQILASADLSPGQTILEVGPGTGVLTEQLIAAGANVIAVEIDRDMAAILRQRIGPDRPGWTLIEGDVLSGKHALNPALDAALRTPPRPFKLIANLPYNIASPLIAILATDYPAMNLALVMIQREVADRLTAPPGGKDYGPLGVLIQAMFETKRIATLTPGCFWPQPTIDSAVIQLLRRPTPLTDNPRQLAAMLQTLFSKRRKQIGSILGRDTPLPPGIDPQSRPEQLSVEQLVALSRLQQP